MSSPHRERLLVAGLVVCFWTLFALANATGTFFYMQRSGNEVGFASIFLRSLPIWYLWASITLVTWGAAKRIDRSGMPRSAVASLHAGLSLVIAAGALALIALYNRHVIWPIVEEPFWATYSRFMAAALHYYVLFYAAILGAYYATNFHRKYRERELRTSQLTAELAQARLDALRMQLHPHFLFNTLNAVSALMEEAPQTARTMLAHLSELLRLALDRVDEPEVSLHRELSFIMRYLDIEKIRFEDRLDVHLDVDPSVCEALVPSLILQPIVENAIRHGAAPPDTVSRVGIHAHRSGDALVLRVTDNGPGVSEPPEASPSLSANERSPRGGIGLGTTRHRLRERYGDAHRFTLRTRQEGGAEVRIQLPYATHADPVPYLA